MPRFRLALLFLAAVFGPPRVGECQPLAGLSPDARLSLVTVYPGSAAHELFGHSAIRLDDPVRGLDVLFNYGTFQFDAFFLPKFLYGKLDYLLWVSAYDREWPHYRERGRSIVEQTLALSPAQREAIVAFLEVNALPENRAYRYRFLSDNCSTRIRDLFEHTLGEDFRLPATYGNPGTFRQLLDRYVEHLPWLTFGFSLVLGAPADAPVSAREAVFLPLYLEAALDGAEVRVDSVWIPLVARTDTTYWNPAGGAKRTGLPAWPLMWALFALGAVWTWRRRHGSDPAIPYFDRLLFSVVGLAGVLLFFLGFIALHDVTEQNWNLLWLWPTHAVAAWRIHRPGKGLRVYWAVAAVVGMVGLAGWSVWPQALHAPTIPLGLVLVMRSGSLALAGRARGERAL
jgi:hypothetical protein